MLTSIQTQPSAIEARNCVCERSTDAPIWPSLTLTCSVVALLAFSAVQPLLYAFQSSSERKIDLPAMACLNTPCIVCRCAQLGSASPWPSHWLFGEKRMLCERRSSWQLDSRQWRLLADKVKNRSSVLSFKIERHH